MSNEYPDSKPYQKHYTEKYAEEATIHVILGPPDEGWVADGALSLDVIVGPRAGPTGLAGPGWPGHHVFVAPCFFCTVFCLHRVFVALCFFCTVLFLLSFASLDNVLVHACTLN